MTANETSTEAGVSLADDSAVRELLEAAGRTGIAGVVAANASSPLAWTELADIADSEGRSTKAYAYAGVAIELAHDQLAEAGWQHGAEVSWAIESNRAYLRALDTRRRAALHLGLREHAGRLAAELRAADAEAPARIASEFTPTQVISVVLPEDAASELHQTVGSIDDTAAPAAEQD